MLQSCAFGLTGCTIYGVKKPPTLKSTTSAEQYERIFWSTVKAKNWQQIPGMLAANVMYSAGGKVLSKDQVIPYLQAANITDFTITGMVVKPNGPDMTLNYTLQLSTAGGPCPDLHRNQRLATSRSGLDPDRPHRTTAKLIGTLNPSPDSENVEGNRTGAPRSLFSPNGQRSQDGPIAPIANRPVPQGRLILAQDAGPGRSPG